MAIKIPRAGVLASRDDVERFLREARSAAQLTHPGIVSLHEVGHADDGTYYLVEEFVPGRTLERRLREGPIPLAGRGDARRRGRPRPWTTPTATA